MPSEKGEPSGKGDARFLRVSSGRLVCYAEYGDSGGLPIFVFHGTPGSRFMFKLAHKEAQRLGLRLIAAERPGFGLSTFQPNRKLTDIQEDVEALADALGIASFAVAGISGGGPYAVAAAALLPSRVQALGVISPIGPVAGPEAPATLQLTHTILYRAAGYSPRLFHLVLRAGRLVFLHAPKLAFAMIKARACPADRVILGRPEVEENLLQGVGEGFRPGTEGTLCELEIFANPWRLPLSHISCPVLFWQGLADRNVPVAAALKLAANLPNCQLWRLEDAGHYWIFDHIGEVLEIMKDAMHKAQALAPAGATRHVSD